MPATMIAATAQQIADYRRAGRQYEHAGDADLRRWAEPPTAVPFATVTPDPESLLGTVWARCELVLRDLAANDGADLVADESPAIGA